MKINIIMSIYHMWEDSARNDTLYKPLVSVFIHLILVDVFIKAKLHKMHSKLIKN